MEIIRLITGLIQGLFSLAILLMASRVRFSWKKTIIYSSVFYIILMVMNVIAFYDKGLLELEKLSLFTFFIPA